MSKIPPDNENFQTIRLLHHSLVSPLKNPLPPINQTAKVCFATIFSSKNAFPRAKNKGMRPASPMVRRKRDFFEWEFTKKMNAVGL